MSGDSQIDQLRSSLNRWNNSRTGGTNASETASGGGFFSSWTESLNNTASDIYQRLPLTRQDLEQEEEPAWFNLSRVERLVLFFCFILGSVGCFTLCIFLFPVLAIKPRKFALLWTMGSLLFVLAFGVLMGPVAYIKHLTSKDRIAFSAFFFGTCIMTLYFATIKKVTILTMISAILELVAVLYYAVSYFPMGASSLRMLSSFGLSTARGALHI
ncbi:similar to Saccharomyces cerevisiae YBL102W SFT2 Non-essential tetra-spanning membrane protein found mostly in the late Golgi, can suppress some sed5 alleles [Maudiozyma barnettii]|uniref:Protein transport protein SFT2 n=1 Tax=Maudiozyma barnettii TaxID=61262 RepID=A0A8H2VIB1_9SACH|nr:Sft2p [Kazachstania barnettii]CAB4255910.1 similar to Saccharomyces cerevisiae YBL102W SFT2 Non-essential tetra-spanning membrane protein found mostly in the late Golgi, can suppress some sed5 alleles [Kazachstania barnettii]CAD1784470.1 similar to Saccharomyces cerevisiae YBL102W SFT2 Non-essential tetra-spanning membrane protein found mostly in the late Golgi, can suppress some sed5 alleles [Kazachstania barnettii]